jgi:hypothetical protein
MSAKAPGDAARDGSVPAQIEPLLADAGVRRVTEPMPGRHRSLSECDGVAARSRLPHRFIGLGDLRQRGMALTLTLWDSTGESGRSSAATPGGLTRRGLRERPGGDSTYPVLPWPADGTSARRCRPDRTWLSALQPP